MKSVLLSFLLFSFASQAQVNNSEFDVSIEIKQDKDSNYLVLVFHNNNDFGIKISDPGLWENSRPKLISDGVEVDYQVSINAIPRNQYKKIPANDSLVVRFPHALNELFSDYRGDLLIEYGGIISRVSDNFVLKHPDKLLRSNSIKYGY